MIKKFGTLILPFLSLLLLLSTNETFSLYFKSQNCKIDISVPSDSCCCTVDQKLGAFNEQPSDSCCCKVKGKRKIAANPLLFLSFKFLQFEVFSNYIFSKPISFIKKIPLIKSNSNFIHSGLQVTYALHLFRLYCSIRI